MKGPEHTELFIVETAAEPSLTNPEYRVEIPGKPIPFVYHTSWLTPEVAAMLTRQVHNPDSPISGIVKVFPVTVGAA